MPARRFAGNYQALSGAAVGGGGTATVTLLAASTNYPGLGIANAKDGVPSTRWSSDGSDIPLITFTLSQATEILQFGQMINDAAPGQTFGQVTAWYADGGTFTQISGGPFDVSGLGSGTYTPGAIKWLASQLPASGPHTQWRFQPTKQIDTANITAPAFLSVAEFYIATDAGHTTVLAYS